MLRLEVWFSSHFSRVWWKTLDYLGPVCSWRVFVEGWRWNNRVETWMKTCNRIISKSVKVNKLSSVCGWVKHWMTEAKLYFGGFPQKACSSENSCRVQCRDTKQKTKGLWGCKNKMESLWVLSDCRSWNSCTWSRMTPRGMLRFVRMLLSSEDEQSLADVLSVLVTTSGNNCRAFKLQENTRKTLLQFLVSIKQTTATN